MTLKSQINPISHLDNTINIINCEKIFPRKFLVIVSVKWDK